VQIVPEYRIVAIVEPNKEAEEVLPARGHVPD